MPAPPRPAQQRIIDAALGLFAEHGVGGTSLSMIADAIGVTKAAVYHQYRTKDEIVLAAAEAELAQVEAVVEAGEAEATPEGAREVVLDGMVDLAVAHRREAGTILGDPLVVGFFRRHDTFRTVMGRLRRLLVAGDAAEGADGGAETRVRTAMLIAALSGAATHPFVVDLDDEVLRTELRRLARRLLDLPG